MISSVIVKWQVYLEVIVNFKGIGEGVAGVVTASLLHF